MHQESDTPATNEHERTNPDFSQIFAYEESAINSSGSVETSFIVITIFIITFIINIVTLIFDNGGS